MPEFLRLLAPEEARKILFAHVIPRVPRRDLVPIGEARSRVLADDVLAPHPLPEFRRSTVDGYAVRADDTFGASESLPAYLNLVGEIGMGTAANVNLGSGCCVSIHTGGMLPNEATAVVMLEHTQVVDGQAGRTATQPGSGEIEVYKAVADGENIILAGEDVEAGQVVLHAGRKLWAADIGGLAALGLLQVGVVSKPRIGLISTGDEVVNAETRPAPGQVRDVNAFVLSALIESWGGEAVQQGIIRDDHKLLLKAAEQALAACEMLMISGGSSASSRDITAEIIASLGEPGVLVHGINVKPGKPTILGVCDGKAVVGLPGNPVSAAVISYLFVEPLVSRMLGLADLRPRPVARAKLSGNLASQAGREDWWPVILKDSGVMEPRWIAEPVHGKSNLIFSLAVGDGLLRIPADATGLESGAIVDVELF
jgi:molybdopterin molybdotransferase